MKTLRLCASGACLNFFLFNTTALAVTEVSWTTLPKLFRQRFAERAPERFDPEAAAVGEKLGGGFKFDPVLAAGIERFRGTDGRSGQRLTTSVTQGSPYGTEVSVSRGAARGEHSVDVATVALPTTTTGLKVTQNLLKNGPLAGAAEGDAAAVTKAAALVKAGQRFDELLLLAFTAFASVEEAEQVLAAAQRAQKIALEQGKAVADLVTSGYKPKADLLVSEQATVRAEMQVAQATQRAEAARRTLALALFQEPGDEPLGASVQNGEDTLAARIAPLKEVTWSDQAPKIQAARLDLEAARIKERIARRDDWPTLAVSAGIERSQVDFGGGAGTKSYDERRFGATLSVPLTSAIRRDNSTLAGLATAKAAGDVAKAEREVGDQHQTLDEGKALTERYLATAERLRDLAERTLAIEQQKYADGKSTIAEVRRVQEESDRAAQDVFTARKNVLLAYLEYARTVGALGRIYP